MSFKAVYAVIDAWTKAGRMYMHGRQWGALLLLARHTDQQTMTVLRSQARLAEELGASPRHVRRLLEPWRARGILLVTEHGGGRKARGTTETKPSRYRIDLSALEVYVMRCQDRISEANKRRPQLGTKSTSGHEEMAAVSTPTAAHISGPEFPGDRNMSAVTAEQRTSRAASATNSGHLIDAPSHSLSEKKLSEEGYPLDSNQPLARPLARSPNGRLAGASEGSVVVEIQSANAIRVLLEAGNTEQEVSRILRSRGVTIDDVRSARAKS